MTTAVSDCGGMAHPQLTTSEVESYYRARGITGWQCGYRRPTHPEATYIIDADYSPVNRVFGAVVSMRYIPPLEPDGVGVTFEELSGCLCQTVPSSLPPLVQIEGEILAACIAIDEFLRVWNSEQSTGRARVILRVTYAAFWGRLTPKASHWLHFLRAAAAEHNIEILYRRWRSACRHRPQGEIRLTNPLAPAERILPANTFAASEMSSSQPTIHERANRTSNGNDRRRGAVGDEGGPSASRTRLNPASAGPSTSAGSE